MMMLNLCTDRVSTFQREFYSHTSPDGADGHLVICLSSTSSYGAWHKMCTSLIFAPDAFDHFFDILVFLALDVKFSCVCHDNKYSGDLCRIRRECLMTPYNQRLYRCLRQESRLNRWSRRHAVASVNRLVQ